MSKYLGSKIQCLFKNSTSDGKDLLPQTVFSDSDLKIHQSAEHRCLNCCLGVGTETCTYSQRCFNHGFLNPLKQQTLGLIIFFDWGCVLFSSVLGRKVSSQIRRHHFLSLSHTHKGGGGWGGLAIGCEAFSEGVLSSGTVPCFAPF